MMRDTLIYINEYLEERYERRKINENDCFVLETGFLKVSSTSELVIIEFAETESDVNNNRFEDCGVYNVNQGKETILELIEKEILMQKEVI